MSNGYKEAIRTRNVIQDISVSGDLETKKRGRKPRK